jgi:predicted Fe-Mo cluster-binding NifX family protein
MRIAVAAVRKDETSQIPPQAGRAPYYLIFNENGKLLEAISNPFRIGGGGAGFGVAKMLTDKGINVVIAERFGMNMIGALKDRKHYEKTGAVKEALREFLNK